jgi:hypothetical protein
MRYRAVQSDSDVRTMYANRYARQTSSREGVERM